MGAEGSHGGGGQPWGQRAAMGAVLTCQGEAVEAHEVGDGDRGAAAPAQHRNNEQERAR